jgi:hypothetical protein
MRTLILLLTLISLHLEAALITAQGGILFDTANNMRWINTKTIADYNHYTSNGWRIATTDDIYNLGLVPISDDDLNNQNDFSFFDNNLNVGGWYQNNEFGYEVGILAIINYGNHYAISLQSTTIGSYPLFGEIEYSPQITSAFLVNTNIVPIPASIILFASALIPLGLAKRASAKNMLKT